jgi:hypothetical protein
METHYPVMETHHPLNGNPLLFVETIFEKQGMFEKKTLFLMLNLLKNIPKGLVGFDSYSCFVHM